MMQLLLLRYKIRAFAPVRAPRIPTLQRHLPQIYDRACSPRGPDRSSRTAFRGKCFFFIWRHYASTSACHDRRHRVLSDRRTEERACCTVILEVLTLELLYYMYLGEVPMESRCCGHICYHFVGTYSIISGSSRVGMPTFTLHN